MSAHPEVEISCDGRDLAVGEFPCSAPPVFGKTATEARGAARNAGWRVNIFRPGSSRRADAGPCAAATADLRNPQPHEGAGHDRDDR